MKLKLTHGEQQTNALIRAVRTRGCHLLFIIALLLPVTLCAAADEDMATLIGKLQEMMATNAFHAASTNDGAMLVPPLPEIPPTLWERYGWIVWLALPFVVMVMAVIGALLLRPRKPPLLGAPAAHVRAALVALRARPEDGAVLSEISRALRAYLVVAFWLPPGEATTAELGSALKANVQVGPELAGSISEFLKYCDERKFSPAGGRGMFVAADRAMELVDLAEIQRAKRQGPGAVQNATPPPLPSNA